MTRFNHVNLTARDVRSLADFYIEVFGCERERPDRMISGETVSKGSGVPDTEIHSERLLLPGHGPNGPVLELFHWINAPGVPEPVSEELGLNHLAFEVEDIETHQKMFLAAGGRRTR